MVNIKLVFRWFYRRIRNCNLFISDENDCDEEDRDRAITVQHQKDATRLFILLLIVKRFNWKRLLVLLFVCSMYVCAFLYHYDEIPISHNCYFWYWWKTFLSYTIRFHPVCSSLFNSEQWIESLYLLNKSFCATADFRTTAASQVRKSKLKLR